MKIYVERVPGFRVGYHLGVADANTVTTMSLDFMQSAREARELWHDLGQLLAEIDQNLPPVEPAEGSHAPSATSGVQTDLVQETSDAGTTQEGGDVPPSVPELREGPH